MRMATEEAEKRWRTVKENVLRLEDTIVNSRNAMRVSPMERWVGSGIQMERRVGDPKWKGGWGWNPKWKGGRGVGSQMERWAGVGSQMERQWMKDSGKGG